MRRLPVLSPSKLDLSESCKFAWSELAPAWPVEPVNDAMRWGNAVGLVGERLVAGDDPVTAANYAAPVFAADDCELAACAHHMAALVATLRNPIAELALALDLQTGKARRLERVNHREYGELGPNEMPMTLDLVGCNASGELMVIDWKTGRGAREKSPLTALQLHAYAVGAAALFGVSTVRVAFAHVDESGIAVEACSLDALQLGSIAHDLQYLAQKRDDVPNPGTHCDSEYCPIRTVCPARVAMAATVAPAFNAMAPIETEEQARAAFFALEAVRAVAKGVQDRLDAYASSRFVDLGNGEIYGMHPVRGKEREWKLTIEAAELLQREAPKALGFKTSKSAITKAVGAAKARELFAILRKMGVLQKSEDYEKIGAFKRDEKEEAA